MKNKLITAAILVALAVPALYADAGTASIGLLQVPAGIRSQGVGGAYTALSDDVEGLDINPAGLAFIEGHDALFIHDIYLENIFFDSAYYAQSMGDAGVFGVTGKYLSAGTITQQNEDATGHYAGPGQRLSGYDYLAGFGYASKLGKFIFNDFTKDMVVGIDLKVAGESLGNNYSNFALSTDLGAIYTIQLQESDVMSRGEFLWDKVGLGAVVKNLGTSFNGAGTPLNFTFGSYTQMKNMFTENNRIRVSADLDYGVSTSTQVKYGLEYLQDIANYSFALRCGGQYDTQTSLYGGYDVGGGLGITMNNVQYTVDYVFMPFGALGTSNKIGLYIKF